MVQQAPDGCLASLHVAPHKPKSILLLTCFCSQIHWGCRFLHYHPHVQWHCCHAGLHSLTQSHWLVHEGGCGKCDRAFPVRKGSSKVVWCGKEMKGLAGYRLRQVKLVQDAPAEHVQLHAAVLWGMSVPSACPGGPKLP